MSAFVVDKAHIDLLVAAAIDGPGGVAVSPGNSWSGIRWTDTLTFKHGTRSYRDISDDTADSIGQMLLNENVRSVSARYTNSGDDLPGATVRSYHFTPRHHRLTAVETLAAIRCYVYQACEPDDWEKTEASAFCQSLKDAMIGYVPGMGDTPWEWDAEMADRIESPHTRS